MSIEKYGVVIDTEKTAEVKETKACPKCGKEIVTPPCDNCGTEPFEKKPETRQKAKAIDFGIDYFGNPIGWRFYE